MTGDGQEPASSGPDARAKRDDDAIASKHEAKATRPLATALGLLLVALVLVERLTRLARARVTDFDDAYTYLRYAKHWLAGQGLSWNASEPSVYGVTSFLHLVVVTMLRWALPEMAMGQLLQVASGAAAIGFLAALVAVATLFSRDSRLAGNWIFWSAVVLTLIAFHEAFVFHAGTGMDTMLSALANAGQVFCTLHLVRRPSLRSVAVAVAGGLLAVLARPDNLLCATLCPGLAIGLLVRHRRAKLLGLHLAGLAGALALLALGAWRWLGSPVPLSFFAKQPWFYGDFAGEFGWNPFRFLAVFLLSAWPFVVALVLFCDGAGVRRTVVLLMPALLTIATLFHFNQIMGHLGRFDYPFLPFFVVAGLLEFDRWLARVRAGHPLRFRTMLVRGALALGLVLGGNLLLRSLGDRYDLRAEQQSFPPIDGYHVSSTEPLPELDSWESAQKVAAIAVAAPAGATFAMSEHGLPGALAPQIRIVDVLGLHDATFARQGFSASELFRREPDLIWMPHSDHTRMLRDILGSDEFWAHYDYYPDAFFHGVAVRTDGAHGLADLLATAWRASYPGFAMTDYRATRGN